MSTTSSEHDGRGTREPLLEPRSVRGTPTWEIAYSYPHQGEWTEGDYLALDLNRMVELSDGCLEFLPMPSLLHQFIFEFLFDLMRAHLKQAGVPGRVLAAPPPVRLWKGKMRMPDLVYLRPERLADVRRQPEGADLAVEIVSPGQEARERDFDVKRKEYARAGIAEYCIVDPEEHRITVLTLDKKKYRIHGEFGPGQTANSVLLPGLTVPVDAMFAAGENSANTTDN